jgi:hypothetical protein
MTTLTTTTLPNHPADRPSSAERRVNAELQLRRNLAISDSARQRVRTRLIDIHIEDSPVKRESSRERDEQVTFYSIQISPINFQLLARIKAASPTSSVSSNESPSSSVPAAIPRTGLLTGRLLSGRHRKIAATSNSSYAFPNEYSIPTIPLPPSPTEDLSSIRPPESPPRFRRKDRSLSPDSPPNIPNVRETSVRFQLDQDDEDIDESRARNTPSPSRSRTQQLIEEEADSYDSAQSIISAYRTPGSPTRGTPLRFRRYQTPAPTSESPSKLLRTLSRVTSTPLQSTSESFHTPLQHGLTVSSDPSDMVSDEEEVSLDEAEKTLDSILESVEDSSARIQRVLEKSNRTEHTFEETPVGEQNVSRNSKGEMSVWREQSFFRRMARKAPGGWAFTPQPKLRSAVSHEPSNDADSPIIPKDVEGVATVSVLFTCIR